MAGFNIHTIIGSEKNWLYQIVWNVPEWNPTMVFSGTIHLRKANISQVHYNIPHQLFSQWDLEKQCISNRKNSNVILTENCTLDILKQIPKVTNSTLKKLINHLLIILIRTYTKQIKKEIFRIENLVGTTIKSKLWINLKNNIRHITKGKKKKIHKNIT